MSTTLIKIDPASRGEIEEEQMLLSTLSKISLPGFIGIFARPLTMFLKSSTVLFFITKCQYWIFLCFYEICF